jgi:signal transduction histidine kinase
LVVATFLAAILLGGSLLLWQAHRNLRDAQQKTSFVSNVSHELKTPLTTIRMYAELMGENRVTDEDKRNKYMRVIVEESQRLTRLVNNVLDFSRLEQGRKSYQMERLSLGETLNAVLDTQQLRLQAAGMDLQRKIPTDPIRLNTDRDAVEQVILNLVDNAIKYAGDGGELTVEAETGSGNCILRIMDRGAGIDAPHRAQVFEKFHRVDDSLTARQPGSGLGLTIARHLARDLGGEVACDTRVGGGMSFTLTLPLGKDE